jgi:hypothetical protein
VGRDGGCALLFYQHGLDCSASIRHIRSAVRARYVDALRSLLDRTPPDVSANVFQFVSGLHDGLRASIREDLARRAPTKIH